jgi:hypothetical protein
MDKEGPEELKKMGKEILDGLFPIYLVPLIISLVIGILGILYRAARRIIE